MHAETAVKQAEKKAQQDDPPSQLSYFDKELLSVIRVGGWVEVGLDIRILGSNSRIWNSISRIGGSR